MYVRQQHSAAAKTARVCASVLRYVLEYNKKVEATVQGRERGEHYSSMEYPYCTGDEVTHPGMWVSEPTSSKTRGAAGRTRKKMVALGSSRRYFCIQASVARHMLSPVVEKGSFGLSDICPRGCVLLSPGVIRRNLYPLSTCNFLEYAPLLRHVLLF